jgi:hypothetical protein
MADRAGKPAPGEPDDIEPGQPHQTPRTRGEKAARQARLAAEMRSNLLKRKRQQRARDAGGSEG